MSLMCHMSAASAFVERKKYKGFVQLILQGFVQRIAHGFVYMNVRGVRCGGRHEAARPHVVSAPHLCVVRCASVHLCPVHLCVVHLRVVHHICDK